jgi:hypothetical protein
VNRDIILGSATLVLAGGYYLAAADIPQTLLSDAIGPAGLPTIYALVLAALSLILIVGSSPRRRVQKDPAYLEREPIPDPRYRIPDPGSPIPDPRSRIPDLRRVAGMLTIGVVYVIAVPWLGYMPSLVGLIMGTTYYQGGIVNRQVVVVAVSGAIFFWLLFVLLLRIPQPSGLWPSLF